jgi:hypothetical protein
MNEEQCPECEYCKNERRNIVYSLAYNSVSCGREHTVICAPCMTKFIKLLSILSPLLVSKAKTIMADEL